MGEIRRLKNYRGSIPRQPNQKIKITETAVAIKRLDSGEYWSGKKWVALPKAKEWIRQATAGDHAKSISAKIPNIQIAIIQTV